MENQQYIQEDEIYLRDYVNIVIKRKKLILAIFLVSIAAAVIASLLMPKVYEMTTMVQLGTVEITHYGTDKDQVMMKKEKAKEIILSKSFLQSIIEKLSLKIKVENLKNDIKVILIEETNLIKIKVVYPGLDMLVKINNTIVDSFIAHGRSTSQAKMDFVINILEKYNLYIKNIEADIYRIESLISKLFDSGNNFQSKVSSEAIQFYSILPEYKKNLTSLKKERSDLEFMLFSFVDFKIFDPPIKPKKPIMPMEQNVLIAGISSLVFGVFLAFLMESWQKTKE